MGNDGFNLYNSSNSKINNSVVNTTNGYGVFLSSNANWNNVTNCNVTTSGSYGYGIFLSSSSNYNALFGNNITVFNALANGIFCSASNYLTSINDAITQRGTGLTSTVLLYLCVGGSFQNTNISALSASGAGSGGINLQGVNNILFNNVSVYTTAGAGIYFGSTASNNVSVNNSYLSTTTGAVDRQDTISNASFFNTLFNSTTGTQNLFNTAGYGITNLTNCTFNKSSVS